MKNMVARYIHIFIYTYMRGSLFLLAQTLFESDHQPPPSLRFPFGPKMARAGAWPLGTCGRRAWMIWIAIKNGDEVNHEYRSRLVAKEMKIQKFKQGERVINEGDPGDV